MDNRRFDALTRSLAAGRNRRQVLKVLFGIGGAAVAGNFAPAADAARRPTPTPRSVDCPGEQIWDGSACICQNGAPCGPECCTEGAQCCDNACCHGICYGEELCCSSPRQFCDATSTCCAEEEVCCGTLGCIVPGQVECCSDADCAIGTYCASNNVCACLDGWIDCGVGCLQGNCCGTDDCDESGTCIENSCCYPECDGIYCGDDGCGGTCGCPEGADCLNGGCFTACEDFGECPPNDCNLCLCRPQQAGGWLCMNTGSDVGNDCATTADCPAGSICSGFYSGDPDLPYICISPCCG